MKNSYGDNMVEATIESTMKEGRLITPSEDFSKNAHIKSMGDYEKMHEQLHLLGGQAV